MLARTVGLGALLALTANGFLIPPSTDLINIEEIQHGHPNINPQHEVVQLPCPGCPFYGWNGTHATLTNGVENVLVFDLKVVAGSLSMNSQKIFPPVFGQLPPLLKAHQLGVGKASSPLSTGQGVRITGYTFRIDAATTVSEDGLELLPITFKILSVERQDVNVPEMTIFLLKDTAGELRLASILSKPPRPTLAESEECRHVPALCKLKSMSIAKLEQLKATFRHHCHNGRPGNSGIVPPHMTNGGRPRPHGGHMHHHGYHHGHHHRFHRIARIFLETIVIPILLGMIAGVLTYTIGMLLGTVIAFVWTTLRGSRTEGYVALPEDEEQGPLADEKEILAKEYEAQADAELPADAPPVYQELVEKE